MNVPADLKYTNTHTWIEDMGDNNYRVGITDFAQDELGDIVYLEPPEVDRQYAQIEECAVDFVIGQGRVPICQSKKNGCPSEDPWRPVEISPPSRGKAWLGVTYHGQALLRRTEGTNSAAVGILARGDRDN